MNIKSSGKIIEKKYNNNSGFRLNKWLVHM